MRKELEAQFRRQPRGGARSPQTTSHWVAGKLGTSYHRLTSHACAVRPPHPEPTIPVGRLTQRNPGGRPRR